MKNTSLTKNMSLLYIRIVIVTLVTLFSSRFIIESLGEIDYGIFNVIFGIVGLFLIISGAMVVTGNRFLISDMVNNPKDLKSTFTTLFFTHLILAVVFSIIIEIVGIYMIKYQLVIPLDRLDTTYIIFHISVISFFASIIQIPFKSVLIANERFDIQAYLEMLFAAFLFIAAIIPAYLPGDRLLTYSFAYLLSYVLVVLVTIFLSTRNYNYVSFSLKANITNIKRIFSFASWNFIGSASMALKMQGTNILLNMFFGPIVNTSRGIAFQINSALNKLSSTMVTAIGPRIIKCYDQNNTQKYNDLVIISSKYSYQIMFVLSLPIFIAVEFVLKLWLGRVPEYSIQFIRLLLIYGLYDTMSLSLRTVAIASKKIKSYYTLISGIEIISLILTYLLLISIKEPSVVFYVYIATVVILMFFKMQLLKRTSKLSSLCFFKKCILPCSLATVLQGLSMFWIFKDVDYNLVRFIILCMVSVLIGAILTILIVSNKEERLLIYNYIILKWKK